MTADDREQLQQLHDRLSAELRGHGPLTLERKKLLRTHRALTDYLAGKIDRTQLAQWLARIESGEDLRS